MRDDIVEQWRVLCEQAANEQDSQKLMEFIDEINRLLDARERRFSYQGKPEAA